MLLLPVLTYEYAKHRPNCTPIYCPIVTYTLVRAYMKTP